MKLLLALLLGLAAAQVHAAPCKQMQAVLDELEALHPLPIATLSAQEARRQPTFADAVKALLAQRHQPANTHGIVRTQDINMNGLPARVYVPVAASQTLPVVVYFHGGGFVIATIDTYDASARAIAAESQAIVVSVEYRKAPENKFPAAHDDAIAAYRWVVANAAQFGGDPKRVALAGESAGGNLALNVALAARDRGLQMPTSLVLIYPMVGTDVATPSYVDNANARPLDKATMLWFFKNYLNGRDDLDDPRMAVLRQDLRGLPSTLILAAPIDPLAWEGDALAKAMRADHVQVEYRSFHGMTHEFFGMSDVVPQALQAQRLAGSELRASFK